MTGRARPPLLPALIAATACGLSAGSAVRCGAEAWAVTQVETEILVPPAQRLDANPSMLIWPSPSARDLLSGHLDCSEPLVVTVFSNIPWELAVRALPAPESRLPDGPSGNDAAAAIPLLWRTETSRFEALGADWVAVASGALPAVGERVSIQLRVSLTGGAVRPGDYATRLEYRLSPARR